MKIGPDFRRFAKAWLIFLLPGLLISFGAALANLLPPRSPGLSLHPALLVLLAVLLYPALETYFLIGCTAIAMKLLGMGWVAAVAAALPIAVLHLGEGGWIKVCIVLWAFVWSAYCYVRMTQDRRSFRTKFIFLFGLHALGNLFFIFVPRLL